MSGSSLLLVTPAGYGTLEGSDISGLHCLSRARTLLPNIRTIKNEITLLKKNSQQKEKWDEGSFALGTPFRPLRVSVGYGPPTSSSQQLA